MLPYQIGFVVEQALGHKTHSQNLHFFLEQQNIIQPYWVLPEWQTSGILSLLPVIRSNWTVHAGLQARHGLKKLKSQIPLKGLFFHTQVPAVLAVDWVYRYPTVISLDATPLQYDRLGGAYQHTRGPAWFEAIKTYLNKTCFQFARHLVTWSNWAKDGLIKDYGISEEKITVLSPGVDVQSWERPLEMDGEKDVIRILFVGGDLTRKGGKDLLIAFQHLNETRSDRTNIPRLELHIVTQTPLPPGPNIYVYRDMKQNSDALKQLYYHADIFCLPTYGDCLPMVLAEAGAAGLPLITTRIAAIPEVAQEKVNGLLVEPGNIPQLVDALQQLINNHQFRIEMGKQSRRIIQENHNAEKNSRQLVNLLASLFREA